MIIYRSPKLGLTLTLAVGLIFIAYLHEKKSVLLLSVKLIIFILASKIIVCRLNFGIRKNKYSNIRVKLSIKSEKTLKELS